MATKRCDVLIVGAGFAGAATALHLAAGRERSILLIEREAVPGAHASGRNACLVRQSVEDAAIRQAAAASQRYFAEHRREVGFQPSGSLLLGRRERLETLRDPERIESRWCSADEARRRVPLLEGHEFEAALETPGDGVMDVWALLQHYLQGARTQGVEVWLSCEVGRISGRGPFQVETSRGRIEAEILVDAAGAWASRVAALAGATPLPLVPWKRHLFVLEGMEPLRPETPFAWSLEREFYFRPDSGRLLLSICDEERSAELEPTVSPGITQEAADLVLKQLPALAGARVRQVWSCFRTKPADGRFVIGWDPQLERFFWVAGLGGHGVGCSWEVGRLAAAVFERREAAPAAFSPGRLAPAEP
jgi:glycine/D-amino acid oxidase-like deaminating enzyme